MPSYVFDSHMFPIVDRFMGWVYRLKECEQTNEIQGIIYEFHEIKW